MSLVGKLAIDIPEGVTVDVEGKIITVKGPRGELKKTLPVMVEVKYANDNKDKIRVEVTGKGKQARSLHGTYRALIANMVKGVSEGWVKVLELVGTGYRAESSEDTLNLLVGYSHPIKVKAPEGINFKVEKTEISVEGLDKELVGLVAAKIRAFRPPEPYKGKGIKYKNEVIRRKAGKAAKTAAQGA